MTQYTHSLHHPPEIHIESDDHMTDAPLPSWNDGPTKQAITEFVAAATTPGPDFVAPADRIATCHRLLACHGEAQAFLG